MVKGIPTSTEAERYKGEQDTRVSKITVVVGLFYVSSSVHGFTQVTQVMPNSEINEPSAELLGPGT